VQYEREKAAAQPRIVKVLDLDQMVTATALSEWMSTFGPVDETKLNQHRGG